MANSIFREKSLQRVSSPEQLNDYIRVTSPGIWLTLSAAIVLLVGFLVWGVVGTLETKLSAVAVSENGKTVCYIKESEIDKMDLSDAVRLGDKEYAMTEMADEPIVVDESFSDYALRVGGLSAGEWVYPMTLSETLPDGVYEVSVVTERVSPISFLFN